MVGGRQNEQHSALLAVIVQSPAAAEDALAVLPQDLRAAIRVRDVRRIRYHMSELRARAGVEFGCRRLPAPRAYGFPPLRRNFTALHEKYQPFIVLRDERAGTNMSEQQIGVIGCASLDRPRRKFWLRYLSCIGHLGATYAQLLALPKPSN